MTERQTSQTSTGHPPLSTGFDVPGKPGDTEPGNTQPADTEALGATCAPAMQEDVNDDGHARPPIPAPNATTEKDHGMPYVWTDPNNPRRSKQ